MGEHTVSDALVATLLRGDPGEENVRRITESFSSADFEYILNRVQYQAVPLLARDWYVVLRKLRDERRAAEIRAEDRAAAERRHSDAEKAAEQRLAAEEKASERRHADLAQRVDELKKPHPVLWATLIIAGATLIVSLLAWLLPRVPR